MEQDRDSIEPGDSAVTRRLRRLASMPVDTTRLDARLRRVLPPRHVGARWRAILTPMRAAAAGIVLLGGLTALIIATTSGPASASTDKLADIYQRSVAAPDGSTRVDTIQEAREALRRQWPGSPELPEMPEHRSMSCCVHEIGRKQLACITFEIDGSPVTMALAAASDLRMPTGEQRTIAGATYLVGSARGVNMVMSERNGTWMCVMGKLPMERLATVAESLRSR